jgi:hypothetical protein
VHEEPVAVDLPKARRPPKPEVGPVLVLQRAADAIEAVPECHVIAQGDREVANLVTERTLVDLKNVYPGLPLLPRIAAAVRGRMTRCPERKSTSRPRDSWHESPQPTCRFAVEWASSMAYRVAIVTYGHRQRSRWNIAR